MQPERCTDNLDKPPPQVREIDPHKPLAEEMVAQEEEERLMKEQEED